MAEFLDPDNGYKLIKWNGFAHPPESFIEVPEGAECAIKWANEINFYKDDFSFYWNPNSEQWKQPVRSKSLLRNKKTIWQRPTKPEELPFIDDEPPAHFVVRPKPRMRMYATLVHTVEINVVLPMPPQRITPGFHIDKEAFSESMKKAGEAIQDAVRKMNESIKRNRLG